MTETPAVPETPTNPTKPTMEEGAATANAASVASEGPATLDVKKEEAPADAAPVKAEPPTAEDLARIKQLLEFYFGESNYRRDKFLQKEAADGKDGFIKITVLLTFNKLKAITTDPAVVAQAVEHAGGSTIVSLNEDKTAVKRAVPLPENDDRHLRTLFVEGIPKAPMEGHADVTVDDLMAVFEPYGKVSFVRLSRDKTTKKLTGTGFVEFAQVDSLQKSLEEVWKDKTVVLAGKPLKLKVRRYEKDHKAAVALARAKAAADGVVGQKRKAEDDGVVEEPAGPKIFDFDIPENFEKEVQTLIPRHVKFNGVPAGTSFHELRELFCQHGHVKYVAYDSAGGGTEALVKFLMPQSASKFLGDSPEVKEVAFKGVQLTVSAPTEEEVRAQLTAKNARKRANLEGRTQHRGGGRGGGRGGEGGGGFRGRGRGRGGGRGRGAKRGRW